MAATFIGPTWQPRHCVHPSRPDIARARAAAIDPTLGPSDQSAWIPIAVLFAGLVLLTCALAGAAMIVVALA